MIVDREVLEVLDKAEVQGSFLALGPEQLDRKLYVKVAQVIELAGGKWNRRAGKHLFEGSAADAMEPVFLTGQIVAAKSEFGFFETPRKIALMVVELADIEAGDWVLEPSAGRGAIAREARKLTDVVDAIEILPANFQALLELEPRLRNVTNSDFLEGIPLPAYDRIVMNPPFAKRNDVQHVTKATKWLKPGGKLVSVVSAAVTFRDDHLGRTFRELIASGGGDILPLPVGSFKESGTDVNTAIVTYNAG
jgi:Methyltransferase small domain